MGKVNSGGEMGKVNSRGVMQMVLVIPGQVRLVGGDLRIMTCSV